MIVPLRHHSVRHSLLVIQVLQDCYPRFERIIKKGESKAKGGEHFRLRFTGLQKGMLLALSSELRDSSENAVLDASMGNDARIARTSKIVVVSNRQQIIHTSNCLFFWHWRFFHGISIKQCTNKASRLGTGNFLLVVHNLSSAWV